MTVKHEDKTLQGSLSAPAIRKLQDRCGRYTIDSLLGTGGMGAVYKAFDPQLNRFVALKIIHSDQPDVESRFLTEARAQGRIDHPNVCKIYEIGEHNGSPFIAMQYIDGETLNQASAKMTLNDKVVIMKRIADAVHAAHLLGLIHRDLKPTNIIVDRNEFGEWRPFVTDFGLAREVSRPGVTVTGMILGTPSYMPPEQALGETQKLDRRSDVYALGATFYELLTAAPPFTGGAVEILLNVVHEEPKPLRSMDSSIPADLEIIVLRCLEKEQGRRYDSARALGEDLDRYRNGEPIVARGGTLVYKVLKKARKNKVAVGIVAVSLAVLLAVSGIGLQMLWRSQKQVELARSLGQVVTEIDWIMRVAHTMPLHDTNGEKQRIVDKMKQIDAQMTRFGSAGYGPGHYALGRGYLLQGDYERARDHLQAAWDSTYRPPEVAYSLGVTLGHFYERKLTTAQWITKASVRERMLKEIEAEYRTPVIAYLRQSRNVLQEAPEYLEAQVSFYEKRYTDTLKLSDAAFRRTPWLYEAKILRGRACVELAREHEQQGKFDAAIPSYANAEAAYREALRIGQSDPLAYEGLSEMYLSQVHMERFSRPTEMESIAHLGIESCASGLKADPQNADLYDLLSKSYASLADLLNRKGQDPSDFLQKAIVAGKQATAINAHHATAFSQICRAYWQLGDYQSEHGSLLGESSFRSAIEYCMKAVGMGADPTSLNTLALSQMDLGILLASRGSDPLDFYDQALANFEHSAEMDSQDTAAPINAGIVFWLKGEHEVDHGRSPEKDLNSAIPFLQRAARPNPNSIFALRLLASVERTRSKYFIQAGLDPRQALALSLKYSEAALKLNQDWSLLQMEKAGAYALQARYEMKQGVAPDSTLDLGRQAGRKATRIDPNSCDSYYRLAQIELLQATWEMQNRRSAAKALAAAFVAAQRAVEINSLDPSARLTLADCHRLRAQWIAQGSGNAIPEIRRGLDCIAQLLKMNPAIAEAYAVQGLLYRLQGRYEKSALEQAEQSFARARSINNNLDQIYPMNR